jgi:toxin HigB-1
MNLRPRREDIACDGENTDDRERDATFLQLVTREWTGYTTAVAIRGFRHKGLEAFFTTGVTSKIQARHVERLRLILGRLNVATDPRDMNLPGLALHPLKGDRRGTWAVRVSGNWRVTFEFVGQDVDRVDYEDYH